MIVKIVWIFLLFMAVLAMFGRLRFPRIGIAKKCRACGKPKIGKGPCSCGKDV